MSRIPAGLLYLTIYNPTLRPTSLTSPDDEDAEEQAQILFYTARERAISRDRMLRQVGLAKALVNFSDTFNSDKACDTVHSQTRRMITVEPEPDFWIHACVELAKTPRSAPSKRKGKDRNKDKDKGKTKKDGPTASQEQVFECHDSSVHDVALRSHILRGYEDFKLIHGTFSYVLSTLGQQALELQLERFFTVWAWKWDIEQHTNFSVDLGAPLHPLAPSLVPIVDHFAGSLPDTACVFVLAPPHIIPSTPFSLHKFSSALIRHVVLRIPPREDPRSPPPSEHLTEKRVSEDLSYGATSSNSRSLDPTAVVQVTQRSVESATASTFMAMANVTRAMDPRQLKWGWPGYLSFGKTAQTKPADSPQSLAEPPSSAPVPIDESNADGIGDQEDHLGVPNGRRSLEVDRESLQEALSDNQSIASVRRTSPSASPSFSHSKDPVGEQSTGKDGDKPTEGEGEGSIAPDHHAEEPTEATTSIPSVAPESEPAQPVPPPFPTLRPTTVNLDEPTNPAATRKWRVWQMTDDDMTVALMTDFDSAEPSDAIPQAMAMLNSLREELARQQAKAVSEKPMPSATNILQPQSAHVLAVNGYTVSSGRPLAKDPEHLYHAKQMFQSGHDVCEVFSRGQNPQHWYVAKRRVEISEQFDHGQVYMEIARKESTLTDADNEVAAVVHEFADHSDGWGVLAKS